MPDTPGTLNFPTSLDTSVSLFETANNKWATLDNAIDASVSTIPVDSTSGFPDSGAISIGGEVIYYTGISGDNFTGCIRGTDGTVASTHPTATVVAMLYVSAHHSVLANGLIQVETKLGNGANAPTTAGDVLQATGAGTSEWGELIGYAKLTESNEFTLGQGIRAPLSSNADGLYVPWKSGDTHTTASFGSADSANDQVAVLGRSYSGLGLYGISTDGTGVVAEATGASGLALAATHSSALTNSIALLTSLRHVTSGTPNTGFGGRVGFQLHSSTNSLRDAGYIDTIWSDASDATRTSYLSLSAARDGVMTEVAKFAPTGSTLPGLTTLTNLFIQGSSSSTTMPLVIDGGNVTNRPALRIQNAGNGTSGIRIDRAGGGHWELAVTGSQSWKTIVVNRSAWFNATGTVYDTAPQAFLFNHQDGALLRVGVVLRAYASQTTDIQQWQDSSSAVLASVSPTGKITGASLSSAGIVSAGSTLRFGYTGGTTGVNLAEASGTRARFYSEAGASDFSLLAFNDFTSSYPALKASGAGWQSRLADDSGFTSFEAGRITANAGIAASNSDVNVTTGCPVIIDGGNITNRPALMINNGGNGTAGIRVNRATGGYWEVAITGSQSWRTSFVNRAAHFFANGTAYDTAPQAFLFNHQDGSLLRTTMVIRGYAAQSTDLQQWQDSSSNVLASVSPTGKLTALTVVSSGVGSAVNDTTQDALRVQPSGTVGANYRGLAVYPTSASTKPTVYTDTSGSLNIDSTSLNGLAFLGTAQGAGAGQYPLGSQAIYFPHNTSDRGQWIRRNGNLLEMYSPGSVVVTAQGLISQNQMRVPSVTGLTDALGTVLTTRTSHAGTETTVATIQTGNIPTPVARFTGKGLRLEAGMTLGVSNSTEATTPGAVVRKVEIFDSAGTSLGFVPIYDSIS
jgi:hypothetical protein